MKSKIVIAGIIFIMIAGVIIYAGFFPIASINDDWLWYRDLAKSVGAIEQLKRTSSGVGLPSLAGTTTLSALSTSDIQRGALEEFIREKIIAQELARVDSSRDWNGRVARDVEGLLSGKNRGVLGEATRELYGLRLDDFKRLVLAPQIREELLRKELELRAKDPEVWLEAAFKNARVKIYFLDYEWKEGELVGD